MKRYVCHLCDPKPPCSIDLNDEDAFTEDDKYFCPFGASKADFRMGLR
jgi:hypothetical protein